MTTELEKVRTTQLRRVKIYDEVAVVVYESGTDIYVCVGLVGSGLGEAVWQVKRISTSSGVVVKWADGNANFDNLASNLGVVAGLSYS